MTFSLYLLPGEAWIAQAGEWFRDRPNYRPIHTGGAAYRNDDTGVEFSFSVTEEEPDIPRNMWLQIPVVRPRTFAIEAEPEVTAFFEAFNCRASMSEDLRAWIAYSPGQFLSDYDDCNRKAFNAVLFDEDRYAADPRAIEAAWSWNNSRAALQRQVGHDIFVPKIVWLQPQPGAPAAPSVTWTFGIPTFIPEGVATHIVLVRKRRPSLRELFSRPVVENEFRLLNIEGGVRLKGVERSELDGRPVLLTPGTGSLEVQALFSGSWSEPEFRLLAPQDVCDADLVKFLKKA